LKVVYSLSSNDIGKPFAINSTSGLVFTSQEIDYEVASSYSLTVIGKLL